MFPLNLNTLPVGAQEFISALELEPFALRNINDYGLLWYSPAPGVEGFRQECGEVCSFDTSPYSYESDSYHEFSTQRRTPSSNFIRSQEFLFLGGDYYQLELPFRG